MIGSTDRDLRVVVIGAGVIGLTTALCLLRRGFAVTIVADRFTPDVTSIVAGALWEWPPAVCGHDRNLERAQAWAGRSYRIFAELAADPATGVFIRPAAFSFRRPVEENPILLNKRNALARIARDFRHDAALIHENAINPELHFRDAYAHLAPMIDTEVYMAYLMKEVKAAGCRVVQRKVNSMREDLLAEFEANAAINCTGLGAREFGDDTVYPLRGAVIRVRNDGRAIPRITQAHCVSHDGTTADPVFIFIVPRGSDQLVLGGFAEPNETGLDIGLDNYEPVREVLRRCVEFLPALRGAEIDAAEPVRVGLRPARVQNVRLEWEPGTRIVHNYGHGGSGVTLSWGCAEDAVRRVEELLVPSPAKSYASNGANHD
jgi:D-amino-acid oxidase